MKIAIAGYGLEGEQNLAYYSKDPEAEITIVDEKETPDRPLPDGVKTILGEGAFSKLRDFDLVVRTAGLAPDKIHTEGKIWSATNEFFDKCPAQIVGITGTKGKGTTASLVESILEAAGKKVWLVGNIGKSAIEILNDVGPEDIVVYELSSFQLWDIEKSPHIAGLLPIEPDHLNVHEGFEDYRLAKAKITEFQGEDDVLVYHPSNKYVGEIAKDSKAGTKIAYGFKGNGAYVEADNFCAGGRPICPVGTLNLPGQHNVDNACLAITIALQYRVSNEEIAIGLASFEGLPHRLEFVREVGGVKYFDDSISTTPGSAIAALRSFDGPKLIILGGSSKGSDFTELIGELKDQSAKAILIGQTAQEIANAMELEGFDDYELLGSKDMGQVVKRASEMAEDHGLVILSPASASLDMFKSYAERGEQFKLAVNSL